MKRSKGGFSVAGLILFLIVFIPVIRDGIKLAKIYYEFYELRAQLAQLSRLATDLSEKDVELRVRDILRDFETVTFDNVRISWSPGKVTFEADWVVGWFLNFYGYKLFNRRLKFKILEESGDG